MPAVEALLERFRGAHTQVLGISVDSVHSHANWARSLGGISFPLLSDFEPKGAVARRFGLYLDEPGIADRASVVIDAAGRVRHASSVTPAGERNIGGLAALCEKLDSQYGGPTTLSPKRMGVPPGAVLYLRDRCGFSRAVRVALENLHLDGIELRNVSRDPAAASALLECSGSEIAPCLVIGEEVIRETLVLVEALASLAAPICPSTHEGNEGS